MIYYFGKDEIIINSLSFLNTDIAPEYNVFSRKKYHFKKTNTENTIKSEIRYMENLWVENLAPNQITPFTFTVFSALRPAAEATMYFRAESSWTMDFT